ncbi:hypothetical protein ABPG74_003954 [Tetrahymena malaccensis]
MNKINIQENHASPYKPKNHFNQYSLDDIEDKFMKDVVISSKPSYQYEEMYLSKLEQGEKTYEQYKKGAIPLSKFDKILKRKEPLDNDLNYNKVEKLKKQYIYEYIESQTHSFQKQQQDMIQILLKRLQQMLLITMNCKNNLNKIMNQMITKNKLRNLNQKQKQTHIHKEFNYSSYTRTKNINQKESFLEMFLQKQDMEIKLVYLKKMTSAIFLLIQNYSSNNNNKVQIKMRASNLIITKLYQKANIQQQINKMTAQKYLHVQKHIVLAVTIQNICSIGKEIIKAKILLPITQPHTNNLIIIVHLKILRTYQQLHKSVIENKKKKEFILYIIYNIVFYLFIQ